ncbi:TPA: phosphohydrolase [Streptococcus pyogenes]|nr:phosphohydrolase [Streptococcus pyogenes]HEP3901174.1 phosphohydrolase [Streptococcus pyogenes]HEP4472676.1 phosphohydrolase [Streptococcus pyogenes]HEP4481382.1 phosphohydrolase [Streptococcus pyogenes]HEP4568116.1 phosphohydrolase [Streptococcus pyogenes]
MIVRNGKNFLTRDAADQYYTIGGTSLVGEKTHETVLRETLEEVGIRTKVNQLAFVVENHFDIDDVFWHNIEFHLDQMNLVPEFLQTELAKWPGHIVRIEG